MENKKTRRGVFINVEDSDITYEHNGKLYKFTSTKKRDIFLARCNARLNFVRNNFDKIKNSKCYGVNVDLKDTTMSQAMQKIIDCIYDTVYDNMLYR